jgi:HK97 family phage prohead protease
MTRTSRSFDFTVERAESRDDGLTLEGYASVFDTPTEIFDYLGSYTETVARGAFAKTLKERTPVLQFDHGRHPMIGSIPLGTVQKASEDDHGLFIRARLSDNWLVQPVREAIRDGAITGMSFQFEVLRDEWNDDNTERTIREVKLYELGPVVFPAYEATTVGVRSEISDLLACENLKQDLARALVFPSAGDADTVTSTSGPDDTPPERAPVIPDKKAADKAGRIAALVAAPSDYLGESK